MFRLVVVYQLVLSVVVGPMLCCCATARLGHDAAHQVAQPVRKSCCGDRAKPAGERHDGGAPAKCPCKGAPAVDAAAPESSGSAVAQSLELLASVAASLDAPPALSAGPVALAAAPPLGSGPASLSADQILFVHHNLRC